MADLKEFVCTYNLPKNAMPQPRLIALYQEYARILAWNAGIEQVESDYRVVQDPFDFDCHDIVYCIVRGTERTDV